MSTAGQRAVSSSQAGRRPRASGAKQTESMRQALLVEPGRVELREVPVPEPGPGELLIEVRCALSCGTDLKTFRRGHPLFPMPTPFGHEFSGVVMKAGEGAGQFRAGDSVMAAPTAPCGSCFFCGRGQENLCPEAIERMVTGAYADYLLLPARVVKNNTFHKPVELGFDQAALLEPLACVVHAQAMARRARGETVLVIGAGAFGMLHLLVVRHAGVRQIVVAGHGAQRLQWAKELGADQVIDASREDAAREVARLNGGYGPDLVIECTGQLEGWRDAFARVRRGGRVVFFGGCAPGTVLDVDTRRMHYDNLSLLAPFHFRRCDVRAARDLLGSGLDGVPAIINARRPLAELAEVFALLERGEALKCAVIP